MNRAHINGVRFFYGHAKCESSEGRTRNGYAEKSGESWNSVKNSGEPSLKSRGGWYDFVAGDLKDRQNPALYQPKWWAGHPVVIFFNFFRSILLRDGHF